jgi:hypothetical protein
MLVKVLMRQNSHEPPTESSVEAGTLYIMQVLASLETLVRRRFRDDCVCSATDNSLGLLSQPNGSSALVSSCNIVQCLAVVSNVSKKKMLPPSLLLP